MQRNTVKDDVFSELGRIISG